MKYIFALISVIMICGNGYAAQLKDTTITGNGTVTGNFKVTGTATVTNLKDLSVVTTTTNPNINVGTGIVTTSGIETIVTFNASTTFVVPDGVSSLKVLVVAGGGGGGSGIAGGGGAGGLIASTLSVTGTVTVTVGGGGAGGAADASNNGVNGSNSVFSSLTAIGGGGGGAATNAAGNGGSGGGARNGTAGTGTTNQGFGGGVASATNGTSGGGGGAGAIGNTAVGSASGAGGVGISSNITGTSVFYAGGGGGGGYVQGPTTAGAGGNGGGGAGGVGAAGTAGTANTGGGGGGGGYSNAPVNYAGGAGGSGVVIVRFITTYSTVTVNDKFRLDNNGKVVVGGTVANNSLTVINPNVNGVAIDLRSDDTNLNGNNFSVARLLADFSSTSYADGRLYLQTATGDNAWKTGLIIKDGKVGIGTSTPATALHVIGTFTVSSGIIVAGSTMTVPDYVFDESYILMPLDELKEYVEINKHLPAFQSEKNTKELNLVDDNMALRKTIEELTLYILQIKNEINLLKSRH